MLNYKKPFTQRRNWRIYELWTDGVSIEELAQRFGLEPQYVRMIINFCAREDAENAK